MSLIYFEKGEDPEFEIDTNMWATPLTDAANLEEED